MTFSNSTSDADPGAGKIAFNNGTLSSVSVLFVDDADDAGADITTFVQSWDDVSNATARGIITIIKEGTPATYATFKVTGAITDASGYTKVAVTHLSSNGSFSNLDGVGVHFSYSGADGSGSGDIEGVTAGTNLSGGGSSGTVTINLADASTSAKGAASFSSDNFAASSGAITIKDDGVATAEIQDDAITTAKIVDDAVTLAKMAPGTDGNIISYDTSGNPVAVATGNSGQVLTSAGSGATPSFQDAAGGGGKVGQVVQTVKTDVFSTTSTSFVDVTGLSVAITPSATTSKILVLLDYKGSLGVAGSVTATLQLLRGSSVVYQVGKVGTATNNFETYCGTVFLDSPSSTSEQTYKIQLKGDGATVTCNRVQGDTGDRADSSITVMEITA
tara:strand:- start:794 stop:1960 length:1167 start_codon:yes stop_codon:yes gene_type:complete